jgi:hypothetical protein
MWKPIFERPLTSDEINDRMQRMMQERARQDAEARKKYGADITPKFPEQEIERPLTSDEINDRMQRMMQERARQDAEAQGWPLYRPS